VHELYANAIAIALGNAIALTAQIARKVLQSFGITIIRNHEIYVSLKGLRRLPLQGGAPNISNETLYIVVHHLIG